MWHGGVRPDQPQVCGRFFTVLSQTIMAAAIIAAAGIKTKYISNTLLKYSKERLVIEALQYALQ
jgi:hypothetical protein